jgi:protein TonB
MIHGMRAERDNRDRVRSAAAVAVIHALLGYALITGLGYHPVQAAADSLKLFDVSEVPPPPPIVPATPEATKKPTAKPKNPEGAAAPPNLKQKPLEVVIPEPPVVMPVPKVSVPPIASQGYRSRAGAAPVPGPGTGAGGVGNGLGSGLYGNGTGGGGGGGVARDARLLRGEIRDSDWPKAALRSRAQGIVHFRVTVAPTGRVSDCTVTRSSGNAALDGTTCRLVMERFRYDPARDTAGRPISAIEYGDQEWVLGPQQPDRWYDAEPYRY